MCTHTEKALIAQWPNCPVILNNTKTNLFPLFLKKKKALGNRHFLLMSWYSNGLNSLFVRPGYHLECKTVKFWLKWGILCLISLIKSHLTVLHYICCMLSAPLEGELVFHACHNNILDLSYSPVEKKTATQGRLLSNVLYIRTETEKVI